MAATSFNAGRPVIFVHGLWMHTFAWASWVVDETVCVTWICGDESSMARRASHGWRESCHAQCTCWVGSGGHREQVHPGPA